MSEPARRYRAFISYSQKDKAYARRIHQALENYRLPRGVEVEGVDPKVRKLGRLFRDDDEMGAATDLGAALQGAIADAENLIVVCSPNAAKSHWVNEEVIHFKRTGRADRIFAVIVDGEPTPSADRPESECFPPALRFELGPDGAITDKPAEPLGLDVRKEPFNRLIARLTAGLIRTPFDALWRREQRRASARFAAILISLALAILTIGAATTQTLWRPELDRYLRYTRFVHATAELAAARPGTTFQDCKTASGNCPSMVVIPEGTFLMGNPPRLWIGEQGQSVSGQDRRRRISIGRFAVSQNEITFTDWKICVDSGGCRNEAGPIVPDDYRQGRDNRPVIDISWDDAQRYVAWLSGMTGHEYRLLTEAEWEYAARGVTSADDPRNGESWSFGNDESKLGEYAWFMGNSAIQTQPVGTKHANPFGLYDIHGNVWEWVQDCYAEYDLTRLDGGAVECDADVNGSESLRVLRGGSYYDIPLNSHSAFRYHSGHSVRNYNFGFRVARSVSGG